MLTIEKREDNSYSDNHYVTEFESKTGKYFASVVNLGRVRYLGEVWRSPELMIFHKDEDDSIFLGEPVYTSYPDESTPEQLLQGIVEFLQHEDEYFSQYQEAISIWADNR